MATFDTCDICYDEKIVIPCGAMGVCDKKICIKCNLNLHTHKCVFCFQEQPKLKVINEMEDRFNWTEDDNPTGVDNYITRYKKWEYGCLEMDGCNCGWCTSDNENNDYQNKILRHALLNEERTEYGDDIQDYDFDPYINQ